MNKWSSLVEQQHSRLTHRADENQRRVRVLPALLAIGAVGCVGLPPTSAPVVLGSEAPLAGVEFTGGGKWPRVQWWEKYQDATLDRLIEVGLRDSPTLAMAHARFDSARQDVRVAGAQSGAHVDLSGDSSRQRLSDNGLFTPSLLGFHWYDQTDLGLQASYTFDWWGKQRAAVAAALDQAHAAQADRSAASLVLTSSIADTYFGWQADQARLGLLREHAALIEQEVLIGAARIHAGLDPADSRRAYDVELAALSEREAALDGSAHMRIVTLAALTAQAPAQLPPLTVRLLPRISAAIPDDVRIDLIARRADVTASRWRVEAAQTTLRGVRAQFYPDISISALAGLQSKEIGDLFQYGSRVPAIAGAVHLPLFDAGRLRGEYGGAEAALAAAVSGYRDTVDTAAREVAVEVTALSQSANARVARLAALDAAQALHQSASARVRQGLVDPRTAMTAAEGVLQQRDGLLQIDAAEVAADVGLQRALGGGYDAATADTETTAGQ